MYADHNPVIAEHMRRDADIFFRGALFAILSIRQPIVSVPDALEDVARNGSASENIWGHKRDAYTYLTANKEVLHKQLLGASDNAARIGVLLHIPGLGIVKTAFVLQLMGYNVACLDSRNVKREKRNPRAYRTDGKPPHKLAGKIKKYLKATEGKSAFYWDAWCTDVAKVYDKTPDAISALHLAVIPADYVPF